MLTTEEDPSVGLSALKAGAYGFVQKPLQRDAFVTIVKQAFEVRRLRLRIAMDQAVVRRLTERLVQYQENWQKV